MQRRALLFTDVVDSTTIVERLGDAPAAALWAAHDRSARQLLGQYTGLEIDRTDGFFLLFDEAADATRYALAYQQLMPSLQLEARVGIHVSEVTLRRNAPDDIARGAKPLEVEGLAKPQAARIMTLARGGQVLLSGAARAALGDALPDGCAIEAHGHYRLKGVEDPVEVYEIGLEVGAFTPPPDTDKAYRVVHQDELWQPLREVRHNLAPERDAFIGRGAELRSLARRLDGGARLLTVAGSGGVGKTRLVRRYARAWLGDWPGGVTFCDLSEARSLDGIHFAVASALDVPLGKDDPSVQLGHAIAGRGRCLVILDNFEQVVEHAAATLGRWIDRASEASFVVTSRELLHLPGEQVLPIEPLPLASEAIELFAARARAQRPEFELNAQNRQAVSRIAELLDGLPLAIELAAARIRVLSAAQIVDRLSDRFALLAGARGSASRQATLEAAIDWSWELLSPWEQAALAQCSVFEGGFTLEAAEAVLSTHGWPEAPPIIDVVQALVDKSLLRAWLPKEAARLDIAEPYFGMYLSIHAYASAKLHASSRSLQTQQRHGGFFARLGHDEAIESLSRHGGVQRRQALAMEGDNLVAACQRAIERGDAAVAVYAARAAWEVLEFRGPYVVGVTLGAGLLSMPPLDEGLRARALFVHAMALHRSGRMDDATRAYAGALAAACAAQDKHLEGMVLGNVAILEREQGHLQAAQVSLEAAVAVHRGTGNQRALGNALGTLAIVHQDFGQLDWAREGYEAALSIHRAVGNRRDEGIVLGNAGIVHRSQGRTAEAVEHYVQALEIHREVGNRRFEGMVLCNHANLLGAQGHNEKAGADYQAALAIVREVGNRSTEGAILNNIGCFERDLGRHDVAGAHFLAALAIHRELGERRQEAVVLAELADLSFQRERSDEAMAYYLSALEGLRAVGDRHQEAKVRIGIADVQVRQGLVDEALLGLAEANSLLHSSHDPQLNGRMHCVRASAEITRGRFDVARSALDQAKTQADAFAAGSASPLRQRIERLRRRLP